LIVGAHDANPNDFVRIQILNFCNWILCYGFSFKRDSLTSRRRKFSPGHPSPTEEGDVNVMLAKQTYVKFYIWRQHYNFK
jgi:hypothetical protein